MASLLALVSFQFKTLDGIAHEPGLEFDFRKALPLPGEALQPIVGEAVARIKRCVANSISSWFHFGQTRTTNMSNFLHLATLNFNTDIEHTNGKTGQSSIVVVIKFYRIESTDSYRVNLDIEEMHSSIVEPHNESAYKQGMKAQDVERLVGLLNDDFKLNGQIEYLPLVERGRLERKPHLVPDGETRSPNRN